MCFVVQRSFLTRLWLIGITLVGTVHPFSLYQPSYSISKPSADYHVIASELSRNYSLAIAYVRRAETEGNVKLYVAIVEENSQRHPQCSINLKPNGDGSSVAVSSLKRLSAQKVLLTVRDTLENGTTRSRLLHLDLQDCKLTAFKLAGEHSIVTYHDSDQFDILVADRQICKTTNARCRISYDGLNRTATNPFDVDLDWKSLRVEYTPSRDFLISGLDNVGVFKWTLLDRSFGTRRDLLAIPYARNMQFVSSQFSICWIEKPGQDQLVHCSEFDEDGQLLFRKTVAYKEPVTLVSLQTLITNRSLLLVGKARCEADWDCWNLYVTQVQPQMKIWSTQYTQHFDCSGNDRKLVALVARQINDSVLVEYVCDNGTNFTYKNYVIDTTDQ